MNSIAAILICACVVPVCAGAADYIVSPHGSDSNPGTEGQPWRSVAKANETLMPGDTARFLPGDYTGPIEPRNNGEAGKSITYKSVVRLKARLSDGHPGIQLNGRRHIVVDGFHIEPRKGSLLWATESEFLTIRNCWMLRNRISPAIKFVNCRDIRSENNICERALGSGKPFPKSGDLFIVRGGTRFVLDGNEIGRSGHSPLSLRDVDSVVVRRNVFFANWGRAGGIVRCTRVLCEDNVIMEEQDTNRSAGPSFSYKVVEGIWRRNLVVGNRGLALGFYSRGSKRGEYVVLKNRIYNNVFHDNLIGVDRIGSRSNPKAYADNIWKNNIYSLNDRYGDGRVLYIHRMTDDNQFVRNTFYGDRAGYKYFEKQRPKGPAQRLTLARAAQETMPAFLDNLEVPPKFMDAEREDYRLAPDSPCIDAGAHLTQTRGAGAGTNMPVADARWFCDGFGIEGEQGDLVFVGAAKRQARVVHVDRERAVLTLARPLEWADGDAVSLPYLGKAPDLGAMESGADREPWFVRIHVPQKYRWRAPRDGRTPLVTLDYERENWEEGWQGVWNVERQRGTWFEVTDKTANSGKWSLRVFAKQSGAILGCEMMPPLWEIDRFPVVRFAYRIPPDTPLGLWLNCFETERDGKKRVCVGGTRTRESGTPRQDGKPRDLALVNLIDDGRWHTATVDARLIRRAYPEVTHLKSFHFCTERNAKREQEYWLDDFVIAAR